MDPKLQTIVESATPEQLRMLEMRDLIVSAFRVTAAGVDVTRWTPRVSPEVEAAKARRAADPVLAAKLKAKRIRRKKRKG